MEAPPLGGLLSVASPWHADRVSDVSKAEDAEEAAEDALRRAVLDDKQQAELDIRLKPSLPRDPDAGDEPVISQARIMMPAIEHVVALAASGTAAVLAREAIRQIGETRREHLRQDGETTREVIRSVSPRGPATEEPKTSPLPPAPEDEPQPGEA
jgi:hypothetical protein